MPYRATSVLLGLLGVLAVAMLVAAGVSVRRSAATGPAWKRRLIASGLFLLGVLGISITADNLPAEPPAATSRAADKDLSQTPEWKTIIDAWKFITPLSDSGRSTTAQRKEAAEKMDKAGEARAALVKRGLLTDAESGVLTMEGSLLITEMLREPPTDEAGTCYDMALVSPIASGAKRLAKRLPLLKQMAESGKVNPEVLERVLPAVERDIQIADPKYPQMKPEDVEARKQVVQIVAEIRKKAGGKFATTSTASSSSAPTGRADLTASRDWVALTIVWKAAEEAALGNGPDAAYPFDRAGKEKLLADMGKLGEKIALLEKQKLLSSAEADLLRLNLDRLTQLVNDKRPVEMKMATCYEPVGINEMAPVDRLQKRLPLLKEIVRSGKVNPQLADKLVTTVDEDIKYLSNPNVQKWIKPETAAAGREAISGVQEQVKELQNISAGRHAASASAQASSPAAQSDLSKDKDWAFLSATWKDAEQAGLGERWNYPFDQKGKDKLQGGLTRVDAIIDNFIKQGKLSETEGKLLLMDLERLTALVQGKRPTEMQMATCYKPCVISGDSPLTSLQARLPLLKQLADSGKMRPEVMEKLIASIEDDMASLEKPGMIDKMDEETAKSAKATIAEVRKQLKTTTSAPAASASSPATQAAGWHGQPAFG